MGLHKFLPKTVLENNKPKSIRKMIQQNFKTFCKLDERECMFKFLDLLRLVYRYDQEHFRCAFGVRIHLKFPAKIVS